ncbi:MAG: PIN domain-containing protein [Prevotellaceae bacterium]|nr:PIN domain-containing protein [Prevotellaceae bacterium]
MTDSRIFIDSNLWVYLFTDDDDTKSKAAKEFIVKSAESSRLVISYQVVNEVCNVLKKKKYTEPEIRCVADDLMGLCEVCGYSGEIIYQASELRGKHSISFWDSHIIASALVSQCDILASEDMQDELRIDGMSIKNVLAASL